MRGVVAIPLTSAEQSYLIRLLQRELAEHEEPLVADLLRIVENAVAPGLVAGLSRELRV
jgi:hypothetical protein